MAPPGAIVHSRRTPRRRNAATEESRPPKRISAAGCGSESPAAPGLTSPIVTGAHVAAAGLLFLVAFVFFRETRASCWLAGHSEVRGGREFLKPTVWVSPSRVVALGGSVTIRCEGSYPGWEFFLRKAGHPDRQLQTVPDGTVAEFPIPSVGWEDGGTYTCDYCSITDQNRCSYPSDPVEIIVGEPSYPKPSISLSPSGGVSLGGAVSVWCWGQRQGVRFVLNKEGRRFPAVDSSGSGAVFFISNVSREHGGRYSCSYHSRSGSSAASSPSDPVELAVRDTSINEGKQPQTLPQEPDPGADGLTYAELDGQVLQAKPGSPALPHEPAQPSMYPTINVSWGAPQ
ncbi:immunoglobulin superfamily member 1-like [Caretta caretta]|uniref:immunoglobulin superfamily member 1-like n=1 Tax=Caretta caretta TaxID=8467 RepID=UPI003F4C7685